MEHTINDPLELVREKPYGPFCVTKPEQRDQKLVSLEVAERLVEALEALYNGCKEDGWDESHDDMIQAKKAIKDAKGHKKRK